MRKIFLIFFAFMVSITTSFAVNFPEDVKEYINKAIPGTDIRFDGVIILPDNTVYLPLYPSLFSDVKQISIKETFPAGMDLNKKPDVVIFNNDFVLMKVLTDSEGKKTVLKMATPPLQVRTGLLPQDMLVPSGLVLPENIKGIIGNLKIDTKGEDVIKVNLKESFEEFLDDTNNNETQASIPQLKDKTLFITTNYSKNIQVLEPGKTSPNYALAQKSIPIKAIPVNNGKFLLVTSYERPFLDIISVADSRYIKQINLSAFPEEIVIDGGKAYITSPRASLIFVVDLNTMSLIQKIRVNGYCEKLVISDSKLFYVDKMKNDIWAVELDNNYLLKNIGKFPNVSSLAFANNNLYIASRTKSRVAVVDYSTLSLVKEFTTVAKPISMLKYDKNLYILGAQANQIQRINTDNNKIIENITIDEEGFKTNFNKIPNSDLAVITDIKKNKYTIFDLNKGKVIKTYSVNVPIKDIQISNKAKLFN